MSWGRFGISALFASIAFSVALAQTATPPPQHSRTPASGNRIPSGSPPLGIPSTGRPGGVIPPGSRTTTGGTNRREPCWKVAGISQSAMQERRTLSTQTREQVEVVCADAALSAAQKQTRIREIRQQEKLQLEGLITPAQREAMRACQQERGSGAGGGGSLGGGSGEGPCGARHVASRHLLSPPTRE